MWTTTLNMCYTLLMKQTLIKTNPYLKDAANCKRLVHRSVRTSCGVEGIYEQTDVTQIFHVPSRGKKRIYKNQSR